MDSSAINIVTTHTADPVITLTGAVTGSGTMTNLGSVSIATTATADPTLTFAGDATGSATFTNLGNATLTVAVADDSHNHSINTISDEHRLFNNMGDNHSTRTDFNATYDFGWRFIQGATNGPGTGGSQYYSVYAGLGNEYLYNNYGMQIAYPRNVTLPYPTIRYREATAWGSWQKISAGRADTLTTARNIAVSGAVTGSANFDGSGNISISTTATSDPTLTLAGDATGSATFTNLGNATLTVAVVDDSHNHIISNVDGLQTALDGKLASANFDYTRAPNGPTGDFNAQIDNSYVSAFYATSNSPFGEAWYHLVNIRHRGGNADGNVWGAQIITGMTSYQNKMAFRTHSSGTWSSWSQIFHDEYHPNADKWTTARTLTLSGAVTGSASIDGSGNVTLATTATSDPTLTLAGDATGSATFTNLGNATALTVAVVNDSHTHDTDDRYYTETESDARFVRINTGQTWTSVGGNALSFQSNLIQWILPLASKHRWRYTKTLLVLMRLCSSMWLVITQSILVCMEVLTTS
jgi:hypothetical protein